MLDSIYISYPLRTMALEVRIVHYNNLMEKVMINIDLSGKNVLITGALGTIGSALVTKFAESGANVIASDMPDAENAQESVSRPGADVRYFGCDLSDLEAVEKAVLELAEEVGGIDIIVNNAAHAVNKPVNDYTIEEFEFTQRVNSSAMFVMSRAVSHKMVEKGTGKIIIVTSATLNGNWGGFAPYTTSKGATFGLLKALARDLGPLGINVNGICPGSVESAAEKRHFEDNYDEYQDWVMDKQCMKTRLKPADIANMAVFLSSPLTNMVTGQNIWVDGGL